MNFTDLRILKTQERLQNALLELLEQKELKAITVKEICDNAGISRNAFYQHYGYKEDLYDQMVASATEEIRNSLAPIIPNASLLDRNSMELYAKHIIDGVYKVKNLVLIMLKADDGIFLRQLTDLIFGQFLTNALSFYDVKDSSEIRLYFEFLSAGVAAFIIRWILDDALTESKALTLLTEILLQASSSIIEQLAK